MAAWSRYGPGRGRVIARCSSVRPSSICRVSHRAPILVVERDDLPVPQPGGPARVVQQHQRQQRECLRLVRHEAGQGPAEVDRLRREVDPAAAPALVEDQVDHRQDGRQPVGELVIGRHRERDAGVPDLALGPGQPLARGLDRDQERQRDLLGRQAAEGAQGERHLRPRARARDDSRRRPARAARRGWRRRRPGRLSAGCGLASRSRASSAVLAVRTCRRRSWSMARLRAVVTSQPAGLAGSPSRGQRSAAMANASAAASSASSMSPRMPARVASTRPQWSRKTASSGTHAPVEDGPNLDRGAGPGLPEQLARRWPGPGPGSRPRSGTGRRGTPCCRRTARRSAASARRRCAAWWPTRPRAAGPSR